MMSRAPMDSAVFAIALLLTTSVGAGYQPPGNVSAGRIQEVFNIGFAQPTSFEFYTAFNQHIVQVKSRYDSGLQFKGAPLSLPANVFQSMVDVCTQMETDQSHLSGRMHVLMTNVSRDALDGVLLVSSYLHIPVVDISPPPTVAPAGNADPVLNEFYLSIFPSLAGSGNLLRALLSRYALYNVVLLLDGQATRSFEFERRFKDALRRSEIGISSVLKYRQDLPDNDLNLLLTLLSDHKVHAVVVYMRPPLVAEFFSRISPASGVDVQKFVWIVPQIGFTEEPELLKRYPTGTLALRAIVPPDMNMVMREVMDRIAEAAKELHETNPTPVKDLPHINYISCLRDQPSWTRHFKQGHLLYQSLKQRGWAVTVEGAKRRLDIGPDGFVSNAPYELLNLHPTSPPLNASDREWRVQGKYVDEELRLDTVIWPTGGPRLPFSHSSLDTHNVRLVLKESLPFVMVTEQFSKSPEDFRKCTDVGLICINITEPSPTVASIQRYITEINPNNPDSIRNFLGGGVKGVDLLCCYGFTIDLAKRVAQDLGLSYVAYLSTEAMVGSKINKTWRGMVGDIEKGLADMAAGATSITPERMEVVDFTVPYYSSAFGTLSARKPPAPNLGAFLDPFSVPMWVLIFLFVHVTAVFMALFEWLSPYGLHPHGRNRSKTFSFPSGLLHTWSLLFSHTYNSKPPKSVASRIIVNAWGMFAVVFIAGYTANLASFMAGRMLDPNIDISKLRYPDSNLRFATVIGTSTEYYLKLYFPQRYQEFKKHNVFSLDEGVQKLKSYELEAVMFDAPMVEYKASTDPECKLIAAGSNFWSDTYGLAFPHGSSLTSKISTLIVKYEATGVLSTWEKKWLGGKAECHSPLMSRYRLSVLHARGVFILILVGVSVSLLVLLFEWLVYIFVVPVLKRHKRQGRWKYIMFISQRLNSALQAAPRNSTLGMSHSAGELRDLIKGIRSNEPTPRTPFYSVSDDEPPPPQPISKRYSAADVAGSSRDGAVRTSHMSSLEGVGERFSNQHANYQLVHIPPSQTSLGHKQMPGDPSRATSSHPQPPRPPPPSRSPLTHVSGGGGGSHPSSRHPTRTPSPLTHPVIYHQPPGMQPCFTVSKPPPPPILANGQLLTSSSSLSNQVSPNFPPANHNCYLSDEESRDASSSEINI